MVSIILELVTHPIGFSARQVEFLERGLPMYFSHYEEIGTSVTRPNFVVLFCATLPKGNLSRQKYGRCHC